MAGCSNTGDYWSYYANMMQLREEVGQRAIVMTFEALKTDFRTEVERLATFLEIELTDEKFMALAKHVSMDEMLARGVPTVRKGVVGTYKDEMTAEQCTRMDELF